MTEPEMSYTHVVRIHPVENGEPNLHNVVKEFDYSELESAENCIEHWNETATYTKAIYTGCVNNATGEAN
jgi:hypothetical protein